MKGGSKYEIKDGAELIIAPGCRFKMDACSEITIKGSGKLIIQDGVTLEIEDGAILAFENAIQNTQIHSSVSIPSGYIDPRVVLPQNHIISSSNTQWINKNYKIFSNIIIEDDASLNLKGTTLNVL